MKVRVVALAAFVACAFLACGRTTPLGPPSGGAAGTTGVAGAQAAAGTGTGGSSSVGQAGAGGTSVPPPLAGADCQPTGDRYKPSSIPAMRRALTGTWALCSELGLLNRPHDALRIGADDRYVILGTQEGALVPLPGPDNQGTVEIIDTSDSNGPNTYHVNFVGDTTGGTFTALPVLSDVPRLMLITNNGPPFYRYRRLDPPGPNEGQTVGAPGPAPSDIAQLNGPPVCRIPEVPRPPPAGTLDAALRGTWVRCSKGGVVEQPHEGFYVGPDRRWVLLGKQDGRLVTLPGLENKGWIDIVSTRQANFVMDIGFTSILTPTFTNNPRQLILDAGATQIVYVYVP